MFDLGDELPGSIASRTAEEVPECEVVIILITARRSTCESIKKLCAIDDKRAHIAICAACQGALKSLLHKVLYSYH